MNKRIGLLYKRYFLIIISILLIIFSLFMSDKTTKISFADNSSEIVMEVSSNRILYGKNFNSKKYMASTTKILTAITIIENCDLTKSVVVPKETVGIEGSSIYLEEGEVLTVKDLLYGLMLRSGNDCAETLAVYCSKSISDFAVLMNETAKKIGAKDSNFVNPHGLHNDNHYTTAYDLALISCYAMKNRDFREIVSTKSVQIPWNTRNYSRVLTNKNRMLNEFEGSTGIKTGYTKKAGRCLVSSCFRNGMELVCVVLNCPPMFERSKELLSDCFDKYDMYSVCKKDFIIDFLDIEGKNGESCGICVEQDVNLPLTKAEISQLKIELDYPKTLKSPLLAGSEIGKICIYSANNLIFTQKLITILDI